MSKVKNKANPKQDKHSKKTNSYYTKFKKVELAASGAIVLCRCTTLENTEEVFCWNTKAKRDLIKANATPDVEIIESSNIPKDKGWNYRE